MKRLSWVDKRKTRHLQSKNHNVPTQKLQNTQPLTYDSQLENALKRGISNSYIDSLEKISESEEFHLK